MPSDEERQNRRDAVAAFAFFLAAFALGLSQFWVATWAEAAASLTADPDGTPWARAVSIAWNVGAGMAFLCGVGLLFGLFWTAHEFRPLGRRYTTYVLLTGGFLQLVLLDATTVSRVTAAISSLVLAVVTWIGFRGIRTTASPPDEETDQAKRLLRKVMRSLPDRDLLDRRFPPTLLAQERHRRWLVRELRRLGWGQAAEQIVDTNPRLARGIIEGARGQPPDVNTS